MAAVEGAIDMEFAHVHAYGNFELHCVSLGLFVVSGVHPERLVLYGSGFPASTL